MHFPQWYIGKVKGNKYVNLSDLPWFCMKSSLSVKQGQILPKNCLDWHYTYIQQIDRILMF